ncbi:hypothetical protein ACFYNW_04730 [Streptomyces virginiae]|uniref:hypothetical protein n=1 Tax=Streptomyces virginiae TaxID=1961 RepID=UPI0036E46A4E
MSGESPTRRAESQLRSHIGWWLGALSAITGILAFILTQCTSAAPTIDQWRVKAEAICEQEMPAINRMRAEALDGIAYGKLKPNANEAERKAAAWKFRDTQIAYMRLIGRWRELEMPGERRGDIEKIHEAGVAVAQAESVWEQAVEIGLPTADASWNSLDAETNFLRKMLELDLWGCYQVVSKGKPT